MCDQSLASLKRLYRIWRCSASPTFGKLYSIICRPTREQLDPIRRAIQLGPLSRATARAIDRCPTDAHSRSEGPKQRCCVATDGLKHRTRFQHDRDDRDNASTPATHTNRPLQPALGPWLAGKPSRQRHVLRHREPRCRPEYTVPDSEPAAGCHTIARRTRAMLPAVVSQTPRVLFLDSLYS